MGDEEAKVVTFTVATESYGIDISTVKEIIPVLPIVKVPETPPWIEGLVDLRGTILPVLDLRHRFRLPPGDDSPTRCIVVIDVHDQAMGLIVDAVRDVVRLGQSAVLPVPPGAGTRARFLAGIVRIPEAGGHRLLMLLAPAELLSGEDVATLASFDQRPLSWGDLGPLEG